MAKTSAIKRKYAEAIVAAALLKAFSDEMSAESRIMLGRYSNSVSFQDSDYRLVQIAFESNITPEAVKDPNIVIDFATAMQVSEAALDRLLKTPVVTEELYHCIMFLTGAVFDLGEIVEQIAIRGGE